MSFNEGFEKVAKQKEEKKRGSKVTAGILGALAGPFGSAPYAAYHSRKGEKLKGAGKSVATTLAGHYGGGIGGAALGGGATYLLAGKRGRKAIGALYKKILKAHNTSEEVGRELAFGKDNAVKRHIAGTILGAGAGAIAGRGYGAVKGHEWATGKKEK